MSIVQANKTNLLAWLEGLEKNSPELSQLGLASAWQAFVRQNKCPLSVTLTRQRFGELGEDFSGPLAVLFGCPISHSLSPALHNFFNLGRPSRFGLYLPTQVESEGLFRQILNNWLALPLLGANVTSPFKEWAFRYLLKQGNLSREARLIGAVNTIYTSGGQIYGDNTDWWGWLASWRHYIREDLAGRHVVVFGAGGAARAIVYALIRAKVKSITIVNSPQRGEKLAADFNSWQRREDSGQVFIPVQSFPVYSEVVKPGYVYIQATVLGSSAFPNLTPYNWPKSSFYSIQNDTSFYNQSTKAQAQVVPSACDLIYNPAQTEFLRLAKESGAKTMNGLGMLIGQAYRSRADFFALRPSKAEEEEAFNSFTGLYL